MSIAAAIDIDGVIVKGGTLIPGADKAIQKLVDEKIPFVFVSNGGGSLESKKAEDLSDKLKVSISPDQIILCHTPFQALVEQYKEAPILILGKDECIEVAKSYGFQQVYTTSMVHEMLPHAVPTRKSITPLEKDSTPQYPAFEAAFVFHDPVDWTLDIQILSDILVHPDHNIPEIITPRKQLIPLYACNADIVYVTEHPYPRYTQGAFVETFRYLFQFYHEIPLELTYYGKPFKVQYEYAERLLQQQLTRLQSSPATTAITTYYGIGDNPKSDIRGARNAGTNWKSILVKTGIFSKELDNDPIDPADIVLKDIVEAVNYLCQEFHYQIALASDLTNEGVSEH